DGDGVDGGWRLGSLATTTWPAAGGISDALAPRGSRRLALRAPPQHPASRLETAQLVAQCGRNFEGQRLRPTETGTAAGDRPDAALRYSRHAALHVAGTGARRAAR